MKNKIVCLDGATLYPADSPMWDGIKSLGDLTIYERTKPEELIGRAAEADIVLTNKVAIRADVIRALPKLRYIGVLATGYNIIDIRAAKEAGITVTNIPSYSTSSVAQHTMALLLAITSRVESYSESVRQGDWCNCCDFSYRLYEWGELEGKTFGIVGFGHIGSAVARIASAFGMNIGVWTSKKQEELPEGYRKMELDELFSSCDVVSLHCPLTEDTRGMVDCRRLSLMKKDAILINTARGPLVDEQALADALREGRIFAAGLDVLAKEPPQADCPLLNVPNCFITPHIAWSSKEARERLIGITTDNLRNYLEGNPVNVVD